MLSRKILLFRLIFASLMLNFVLFSSFQKVAGMSHKDILNNFMKVNQKFDFLSDKVDELELNTSRCNNAIDAREIKTNITHLINTNNQVLIGSNNEILRKMEKFQMNLNKIEKFEANLKNIEKFEANLKNIEQLLIHLTQAQNEYKLKEETFTKISSVCLPNPCLYGGRCYISSTGSEFRCLDCPKLTNGKRCENLNCTKENKCRNYEYRGTPYFVYESKVTWSQGKEWCEGMGMSLAMPKDHDTNEFIFKELTSTYDYLWMGIKKDAGASEWRWLDGSALGQYLGGWPDMKSQAGPRFGLLYRGGLGYRWTSSTNANSIYFALCQPFTH